MANTLSNVLLFYYKIGSKDYPLNTDPNSKFGYDFDAQGNLETTPVFSYSINEVEKAFVDVRHLTREAVYESDTNTGFTGIGDDTSNLVNNLLVENGSSSKYAFDYSAQGISNANPSKDAVWQAIFNICEWLGANQSSANGNKWSGTNNSSCINTADSALSSDYADGSSVEGSNPYKVSDYIKNSITIYQSSHTGRIAYATFKVYNSDDNNSVVNVTAYFDANAFVERSTNVSYAVYRYEDLDNDSTISNSEFDSQIVNKLFEITKNGKYKTYSSIIVQKRISDDEYTDEQFFVFSSLATTLSSAVMLEQVKQYIQNLGLGETYNAYTYPSLFGTNTIMIVPVWDNQITTSDNGSKDVHPISLAKIESTVTHLGFSTKSGDTTYHPTELFYIGPGAGWTPSVDVSFIIPLLAIENNTGSGIVNPISARFPDYQPIYGQNLNTDAAEFHFILLKVLFYLNDSTNELSSSFKNSYSVSITNSSDTTSNSDSRKIVTFTFGGNLWSVYGPENSTATSSD